MTSNKSEKVEQIVVAMTTKLLAQVDNFVDEQLFVDRQEFIRIAIRSYTERMREQQKQLERV